MPGTITNPDALFDPAPFGFSHVVAVQGGRTIYVAGQGGENRDGALAAGFEAQMRQAFANLAAALSACGAEPRHVARITTFIVDHDHAKLGLLVEVVRGFFGTALPAQTLVPVPRLALDGMLFEVEAVAVID